MLSKSQTSNDLEKPALMIWFGILVIYLALFIATGYVSFVKADIYAKSDRYERLLKLDDQETKTFLLEVLQKEESEHIDRRNLAGQSFHVVLGALLGFMSASAASIFRRKNEK